MPYNMRKTDTPIVTKNIKVFNFLAERFCGANYSSISLSQKEDI